MLDSLSVLSLSICCTRKDESPGLSICGQLFTRYQNLLAAADALLETVCAQSTNSPIKALLLAQEEGIIEVTYIPDFHYPLPFGSSRDERFLEVVSMADFLGRPPQTRDTQYHLLFLASGQGNEPRYILLKELAASKILRIVCLSGHLPVELQSLLEQVGDIMGVFSFAPSETRI